MRKKVILAVIVFVLCIVLVAVVRTIFFPAEYELQSVLHCCDVDDTFFMLERRYELSEEGMCFHFDAYGGQFPSEKGEDYKRILLCFAPKSHSLTRLYAPNFVISELGENTERLVYYNLASNIEDKFSEEYTCNMCLFFYTGGLSEEEIDDCIIEILTNVKFTFTYEQEYVGTHEETFALSEKDIRNAEWGIWSLED